MPLSTTTIQYASAPRIREPRTSRPAAPMTDHQRAAAKAQRDERQEKMDRAIAAWFKSTLGLAYDLGKEFGMSEKYFLNIFFSGGANMVHHHEKTNAYSAYLSLKAREIRIAGGTPIPLAQLQAEHLDAYRRMPEAERVCLAEQHAQLKEASMSIPRPTARSCIQDVANTLRNIELLIVGLQRRVGVHAMLCIFRNSTNFAMDPQWLFTHPDIESYLPIAVGSLWDTAKVGTRLEAFSIAGCNPSNMLQTQRQKVDFYKKCIRNRINTGLREITGLLNLEMEYVQYYEKIVFQHSVFLDGWTHPTFTNPSHLNSSLDKIMELYEALSSGTCKWVKLSEAELQAKKDEYKAKLTSGEVTKRVRKPRNDAGSKRGPNSRTKDRRGQTGTQDDNNDNEGSSGDDESPAAKRPRKDSPNQSPSEVDDESDGASE